MSIDNAGFLTGRLMVAIRVFFSYSHDDEEHRNQLEKHLALMRRQGLIDTWHDRRLLAGQNIDDGIDAELEKADIVLLLVSSSFIASDYCYSREMERALERHNLGETRVVPVIARNCDWHSAPFGKLKAVPRDGKPIVSWANFDEAYTDVAREIRAIVEESTGKGLANHAPAHAATALQTASTALPRSGNMRVKKHFTDLEKTRFLRETFDFIARYFECSLEELSARNADIETTFQRVDSESFTSEVFRGGKRESQCVIRIGGSGFRDSGVTYSAEISRGGNSFNERISVEADDQSMFLRSMGMSQMTSNTSRENQMTAEGAAELFWQMLIQPLQ